jgi:putative heme-binding domain-containing protein
VITTRPAWARLMVETLRERLTRGESDEARRTGLREALVAFHKDSAIRDLVASLLRADSTPVETRVLLLDAIVQAPVGRLPAIWIAELRWCLENKDQRVVRQAMAILRASGTSECDDVLLRFAAESTRPVDARIDALAAITRRQKQLDSDLFDALLVWSHRDQPGIRRLSAAGALGQATLTEPQLEALAKAIATAGALELPRLLPAFERSKKREIGAGLIGALEKSPGFASLTPDTLRQVFRSYPKSIQRSVDRLVERIEAKSADQAVRLTQLEGGMKDGDPVRGRELFFGQKAACATCHTAQNRGGHVGPELTKIGGIRSTRDLLEAVVYPSASFVRGFEPYLVATQDGQVYTGVIATESSEVIDLVVADRNVVRLPRASIEEIEPARTSIMPQGLDAQLTRKELADIVSFLGSLK